MKKRASTKPSPASLLPLERRVAQRLTVLNRPFETKTVMGVLAFMVEGKMCVGIKGAGLIVRLDPSSAMKALEEDKVQPMRIAGRISRGFILVDASVLNTGRALDRWLKQALAYNPKARASGRRKGTPEQG